MSDPVSPSQLRQDLYRLLDGVLETGRPLEILRKGRLLRVVPDQPVSRLDQIRTDASVIVGDPEDLVSVDWSSEWDPARALHP
ncbi:type II toxin-antitoxin system Phd/YefM family antitoxin [Nocardioides caeni]|uniref:Type II toxin-antitoxin system Phd/YefM family antitoxin n=1 Tax=Nocardioides caeni TaxID=574700 RepID=A0A4S8NM00_9ACTN|nr:type II toxin-antitoxin system Phd/YefM family antitoxin [Nocardioides caeni]THV16044.1 type II toxin-antitoxin system Phd/YefM family antitoxin [Nocardioides caeni]